jgi:predicted dienelactone hydrolase
MLGALLVTAIVSAISARSAAAALAAEGGKAFCAIPGPLAVETLKLDWSDASRGRVLPVKVYYPKEGKGPFPVIIFSHGLGGTREGYEYLGRQWASQGYFSLHLQHPDSDDSVWRGKSRPLQAMREAVTDPKLALQRPLDVKFALDRVSELNLEPGKLQGRLDTNRIGVAGHSFGAFTTLAVAGQVFGPRESSLGDARVKAAIAMSAPVPQGSRDQSYVRIAIPILHMTGTEDTSVVGGTTAPQRRIPFDKINGPDQYLLTFTGGDHAVFSGRSALRGNREKDDLFHSLILQSSTAFWDAYLKGETKAREWLAGGKFEKLLGPAGVFEQKHLSK